MEEAAKTYEELLFSYAQMTEAAPSVFEMGRYYEISSGLDLAVMEQDKRPPSRLWKKCCPVWKRSAVSGNHFSIDTWISKKGDRNLQPG